MAGIPLFDPSYLSSPTMFGSVSPKTADILAAAGKQVADTIEKQSTQFEAEQKAPQIAAMMGQGLTLLSKGDTSGFSLLAQAHATGATNPFLAKMTADALAEGNRTFSASISESNAQHRFDQSVDVQDRRDNRLALSEAQKEHDRQEAALEDSDRQLLNKHQTETQQVQIANQKQQEQFQQTEAARKRSAELSGQAFTPGTPPSDLPLPEAPTPRSRVFGGQGAEQVPVSARGVSPKKLGASVTPDGGLFGDTGLPNADTFVPGQGPVAAAPTTASPVSQAAAPTPQSAHDGVPSSLVNENIPHSQVVQMATEASKTGGLDAANAVYKQYGYPPLTAADVQAPGQTTPAPAQKADIVQFGKISFHVATPPPVAEASETVKTGTGTQTFKSDKKNDPGSLGIEFKELVAKTASLDSDFAKWASNELAHGHQVTVEPDPNDAKGKGAWLAKSDGVPMGKENPAAATDKNAPAVIPRPVSAQVGEAWTRAQSILPQIQQYVQKEVPKEEAPTPLSPDDQAKQRQIALNGLAAHDNPKSILANVNANLQAKGVEPIKPDEISKAQADKPDAHMEAGKAELAKLGVTLPDSAFRSVSKIVTDAAKGVGSVISGGVTHMFSFGFDDPNVLQHRIDDLTQRITEGKDTQSHFNLASMGAELAFLKKKQSELQAQK